MFPRYCFNEKGLTKVTVCLDGSFPLTYLWCDVPEFSNDFAQGLPSKRSLANFAPDSYHSWVQSTNTQWVPIQLMFKTSVFPLMLNDHPLIVGLNHSSQTSGSVIRIRKRDLALLSIVGDWTSPLTIRSGGPVVAASTHTAAPICFHLSASPDL